MIAEAARLVPGKPIQYVINTHHHFDHAGGLRTYLSQGTTIVTHESNKQYYLDILFHPAPRTLQPDRLALFNPMYWISRRPPPIETVAGEPRSTAKYVVTDGERILEIDKVEDMSYELGDRSYAQGNHSVDMLIAYLPKEKILFNADLYSPPAQGRRPPPPTARHAHAPAEHQEAEARRRAARARARPRRHERGVHADRHDQLIPRLKTKRRDAATYRARPLPGVPPSASGRHVVDSHASPRTCACPACPL